MARDHLHERFQGKQSTKIRDLAEKSAQGSISGFQGIFQVTPAGVDQIEQLSKSLETYRQDSSLKSSNTFKADVEQLMHLMQEVKAISHQALLLHGQRIQKAQEILKHYREGAFTAWLLLAYGNRQTPYNLLQYFEFFQALPPQYRQSVENLPRQVVYQLASRREPLNKKLALIDLFAEHSKADYLHILRREMPLRAKDCRQGKHPLCTHLERAQRALQGNLAPLSPAELEQARALVKSLACLLAKQ